jgi:hypothetical protein
MSSEKRAATRYFVTTSLTGQLDRQDVEVIDISVKGARLQTRERVTAGASLPFTIQCSGASVVIPSTVQWCELGALSLLDDESDRYLCGIAFDRAVPVIRHLVEDMLAAHDAAVIEEARHGERYRITCPVSAWFGATTTARVLDLSFGGARIATATALPVGSSELLRFRIADRETPVDVRATVVWSRPAERKTRFESGLRIEGEQNWLRTIIDELSLRNGAVLDPGSLSRKFDPMKTKGQTGLLSILR